MAVNDPDQDPDQDEYDEEADSDFGGESSDARSVSSSEDEAPSNKVQARQTARSSNPLIEELDSGDEVTIKEREKRKRKQRQKKESQLSSEEEDEGWRAKTRSMRAQAQEEGKSRKVASIKASSLDLDKIWEQMNKPGPLPPVKVEGEDPSSAVAPNPHGPPVEPSPALVMEDMVTIRRQFKFAGEVHVEEKTVPKSSAEARLWLAQQENEKPNVGDENETQQRPLRRISRFDPNYSNLEAFRNQAIKSHSDSSKPSKLNVVEKSKMDWAVHVDAEGLKDELDVHAKAKDAYLNRMDFLSQVEMRKEGEARSARLKG